MGSAAQCISGAISFRRDPDLDGQMLTAFNRADICFRSFFGGMDGWALSRRSPSAEGRGSRKMDCMQGQITATTYVDVDLVYSRMVMVTCDLRVS